MSSTSLVSLYPVDGGDPICIPSDKTVIGRGSLFKITDKRVSRNHATLEIVDGKLIIVPIHTNPCFYKAVGGSTSVVLPKDKPQPLEHGDVISLLPDKLFFKIHYKNEGLLVFSI
ncbi:hypothetical protein HELRODRAFT_67202 [Helobdella robusta]|uniref:FHA domain-containing protein n=1 Tax=Helobdella robusta TaxID=6412 RepID=T1FYY0_HELRO|nr:hypothetical protein HELRODRAFT_67202 [Helobdella robusta]ESN99458.1 hypothetical protein HELRODRAFT_67202 [Helobdella robusta]